MMDPLDIHAYVDGELTAEQRAQAQTSIKSSTGAAKEVEAIQSLKVMLRDRTEAPEIGNSWKACVRRLDEVDKSRKAERVVNRWAPAMCFTLFIVIVGAGWMTRHTHWTSPDSFHSVARFIGLSNNSGVSSIAHEKRMLAQSFSSTPEHLQIRGVSDYLIDGTPVRRFDVRDASGNLQLLLVHEQIDFEGMRTLPDYPAVRVGMVGSTNCAARIEGNDTIVVIADRSYKDLADVLGQVKAN